MTLVRRFTHLPALVRRVSLHLALLYGDSVEVSDDNVGFHLTAPAGAGGEAIRVTVGHELTRCVTASSAADAIGRLAAGPHVEPPLKRDVARCPEVATFNAWQFLSSRAEIEKLNADLGGVAGEDLRNLFAQMKPEWGTWFGIVGRERLVRLDRVAGPSAVALRSGFHDQLITARNSPLHRHIFEAFLALWVEGSPLDPDAVLRRVMTGSDSRWVQFNVVGRAVEDEVARLAERVLPNFGPEPSRLVAFDAWGWNKMFWSNALTRCFPTSYVDGAMLALLPHGISLRAEDSVSSQGGTTASVSCREDGSFASVVGTFKALTDDGLDMRAALETAVAVVA